MNATEEQRKAIEARGKVLVSASAGAGKTEVMITRLADILEEGADLENVLAVTFTKKAAAQMKERLRSKLIDRLSSAPTVKKERLRRQLGKINAADISTIHSFCARLVRTYFYALDGVDASFEIAAEEAEVRRLQNLALDNLFDRLYGENDEKFLFLVERLKKKRSDDRLRKIILSAYENLRIRPGYEKVVQRTEEIFTERGFGEVRSAFGARFGERCRVLAESLQEFAENFHPVSHAEGYFAALDEMKENLLSAARSADVFVAPQKLGELSKPRVRPENAEADAAYKAFVDPLKKAYRQLGKGLGTEEEEREAFFRSGDVAKAFVGVLMRFDAEYAAVKREEGKLDYGDLEHLAYALVGGEECDAAVKDQINRKYAYVFVDEYQDVNPIQDAIVKAVAGGDLFTVGDEKQAIYGFRGSRSQFFREQSERASEEGKLIVLPHNFRSSPAVVDFVNDLFPRIMTKSLCGFDYADGHAMIGAAAYADGYRGEAEICEYDSEKDEKQAAVGVYSVAEQAQTRREFGAESLAVVGLVKYLLTRSLYENGQVRPVQQGDICILTRKKNDPDVAEIEQALLASEYSVDGASEENVCNRPEIRQMLDILSYLDNAEQDVPLVCALLSPLGGLTEDDLAKIRLFGGTGKDAPPFRRCAEKYARSADDGIAAKLDAFYAKTGRLRRLSEGLGAARLIDVILEGGGFVAQYAAKSERLAALRRLQKEAYAPTGELSLNAFLARLKAADYKVTTPVAPSSDSVKIMTMHASKGLEFPVVILADVAAGFKGEEREEMPYDEAFGFAPYDYDRQTHAARGTLLRRLVKARADAEELKNEINLFYVACTRAKYSLHILTSKKKDFDPIGVYSADCYADLFDPSLLKKCVIRRISPDRRLSEGGAEEGVKVLGETPDPELSARIAENFFSRRVALEELPVKSSATRLLNFEEDGSTPVLFDEESGEISAEGGKTGVESGLAYHRFLQLCDFSVRDEEGVRREIDGWLADGSMTEAQANLLDTERLLRILAMPALASVGGRKNFREREFICRLPSRIYKALRDGSVGDREEARKDGALWDREEARKDGALKNAARSGEAARADGEEEGVIVQGAIDLLVLSYENGKAVAADVVDYKYSSRPDEYLKRHYFRQLALYREVTARIYGLPKSAVSTTILNIRACTAVELHID